MVLHTTGYDLREEPFEDELTGLLAANQLSVEQRFFPKSRPEPANWDHMTIVQAAADHHRIVAAFNKFYSGAWAATGGSKGGMTSVFHRRFYPEDIAATVAYVAPISFGAPDQRYPAFFSNLGQQACTDRIHAFQRELLVRRDAMRDRYGAVAERNGYVYDRVPIDVALESDVASLEWSFWQYFGESWCEAIPGPSASDDALFEHLSTFTFLDFGGGDAAVANVATYFYQAATQLGFPAGPSVAHIADLMDHNDFDYAAATFPIGAPEARYEPAPMRDINDWVMTNGRCLLFVYGEYDPWTAGAFELGDAQQSIKVTVARGTHFANAAGLARQDRDGFLNQLAECTGVQPRTDRARSRARRASSPAERRMQVVSQWRARL